MFDVIHSWIAEHYPQLYVRPFDPVDVEKQEQIRVYVKPDSDQFNDCLVTVYSDPNCKSIYYAMPMRRGRNWEHMVADINRPDYFARFNRALNLAIKNFAPY